MTTNFSKIGSWCWAEYLNLPTNVVVCRKINLFWEVRKEAAFCEMLTSFTEKVAVARLRLKNKIKTTAIETFVLPYLQYFDKLVNLTLGGRNDL